MSNEKTSRKLIPDAHLEMIKKLTAREMDEVSKIASMEGIPFHLAYIRWRTDG